MEQAIGLLAEAASQHLEQFIHTEVLCQTERTAFEGSPQVRFATEQALAREPQHGSSSAKVVRIPLKSPRKPTR
jgi:hypothetical protein